MRIEFKRIEIHNFKSFEDEVFEFDVHKGLNLVCGKNNDLPGSKNGSGKSTLFQSLIFSLFGQTQENIKNENIVNKYVGAKDIRVATYFDIETKHYKVVSGHNDRGRPYCQLSELVDNDEIDLTKSTMSETRKYLQDEILHCDLSIFLRTVLLSSDQNYNFFRLRKCEKKEFIEKLFDIQVFGEMYNAVHRDALDLDKQLVQKQDKLMLLNKNDDEYQQRMKKHDDETKEKLKSLASKLDQLKNKKTELADQNIKSNSEEVTKYESALDKVNEFIRKLNDQLREVQKQHSKIELAVHKFETSKESKQKAIDKHSELLEKLCADCKQIFKDYYSISGYAEEIKDIDLKLKALSEKHLSSQTEQKTIKDKIALCETKINDINQKIKQLTAKYNEAQQMRSMFDAQIQSVENEIAKTEKAENPYTDLYQSNQVELKAENDELKKILEKYKYVHFAENIVSQDTLRKFIVGDLIGLLNNKIKTYLTKLGTRYNVVFDADMNYAFTTEGGSCEYDNFSSGERARLMIAACFAFRDFMHIRNNFSSNILILDEFIDGAIDSVAIESILEILKDFSEIWNQNIFVISHRHEVNNDLFDSIIQVVKTDNIAKITYL